MVLLLGHGGFATYLIHLASAMVTIYPLAVVSFGYCAPLVGSIAWFALRRTSVASRFRRSTLVSFGSVFGALVGLIVMLVVSWASVIWDPGVAMNLGQGSNLSLYRYLTDWGIIGLVAGAASGVLVAVYLKPRASDPPNGQG
jgi:hypothetical protein